MRWKQTAAVIAVAAVAVAAACGAPSKQGGGSKGPAATPKATGVIGEGMNANAPAPAPEIPGAKKGGTVTVVAEAGPETLDPTRNYYIDATSISRLFERALTQYLYDDKTGTMTLVPDMATDLGKPNKALTEWTYTLRDGLKYDDGTDVKAADVAYAIKRQFAVAELADGPTYALDFFVDGDTYKGPFQDKGKEFGGVTVKDDKTLVLHMRKPFADMPYFASFPDFTPIPEAADTKTEYELKPKATGPYKVEAYDKGKSLTLVRNQYWDPKTDTARHAYPDRFEFKWGGDGPKFHKELVQDKGSAQTMMTNEDVYPTDLNELQGTPGEKRIVPGRQACTTFIYFNFRKIKDIRIRKAIGLAWNVDDENKASKAIPGVTWQPATTILPSVNKGYLANDAFGRGGKGLGDPEAAKKLLKAANALNYELVWYYSKDTSTGPAVNLVRVEALKKAGFNPKPIGVSSTKIRGLRSAQNAPTNMRSGGWCDDWPSGSSVFPAVWDPKKNEIEGSPTPTFIDAPELSGKMEEILKMSPSEGAKAWGELDKYIMDKYLPAFPIGQGNVAFLHGSKVKNLVNDETFGQPWYVGLWVEP